MSRKPAESFFKCKERKMSHPQLKKVSWMPSSNFKKGKPTEEVIDTKKVDDRKAEIKEK